MSRPSTTTILAACAVLAATLVVGCSSPTGQPLATRTVTVAGERWVVYEDPGEGMRGLPGFGTADGMLFDMGQEVDPRGIAFGMEGVGYPLDIAFFGADGMVVSVDTMAPCDAAPCPLYHALDPYRWAIEAPVGAFGDLAPPDRLVVGD
jgi:uncharacterized membrane protein (UPF0127 family)